MKHLFFYCFVLVTALFCSCQNQPAAKTESDFYRNFNLGEIVEKMNIQELQPSSSSGGRGNSAGKISESRRNFDLIYIIEEQNSQRFDEESFLNDLKSEIIKKMGETDIKSKGSGSGNGSFYFNYSNEKTRGWIEVLGARLDGNKYKLWCLIREETKSE